MWDVAVAHDLPGIDGLAHVEVHAQTDGNDGAEQDEEAHDVDVPLAAEPIEGDEQDGESQCHGAQNLREAIDLEVEEADLGLRVRRVHDGACLSARVHDHADGSAGGQDRVRPQHMVDGEGRDLWLGGEREVFGPPGRRLVRRVDRKCADERVQVLGRRTRDDHGA